MKKQQTKQVSFSLRLKLVIAFIVVSLISICMVTVLSINKASSMLTDKAGVLMTAINDQFSLSIDNYFKDFEDKAAMIFSSEEACSFNPKTNELNEYDTLNLKARIQSELAGIGVMISYNDFCIVYSDNSSVGTLSTTTAQSLGVDKLYEMLVSFKTRENTADGWKIGYEGDFNKIYYVKQINSDAVLMISIYSTELNSILQYSEELEGMEVSLVSDGNIVFSTDKKQVGNDLDEETKKKIDGHEHFTFVNTDDVVSASICLDDWQIVSHIPKSTILAELNQLVFFNIVIAVICILISTLLGLFIAMNVVNPIRKVLESMKRAADGDFTALVEKQGGHDEVALLIENYHEMLRKMSSLIRNVQKVLFKVEDSSNSVSTVATSNQEVSNNVSIAIDGISVGIAQQLDDSRNSFKQLESLANSINDTISYVGEATESMNQAIEISNDSIGKVQELSKTTEISTTAIENVSESFSSLISEMKNIQAVAESILEISSDTGLLALNASIEAAKAGELGRGFAVVADQISRLSVQTEEATQEINTIVSGIYQKIDSTVQAMQNTTSAMDEQASLVHDVSQAFSEIVKSTENVKECVNHIAGKAQGMGRLKDISLQSIDSILEVSESSSANAEEVMAITMEELNNTKTLFSRSEELKENVEDLKEALSQFTVAEEGLA